MVCKLLNLNQVVIILIVRKQDTNNLNVDQRKMTQPERDLNSRVIAIIFKSMDLELMGANSRKS